MPTYRLTCVLRFVDGRAGSVFDAVNIGADGPDEAVTIAQQYQCSTPRMALSVAVLTDPTGAAVWSLRAPDHVDITSPGSSSLSIAAISA